MSYVIVFLERAVAEYEAAAVWYKERSIQAAENFEAAVDKKLNVIIGNPLRQRKTYREFREIKVNRYPFDIIYLVDEIQKLVIIFSIYHHKRNPKKKYRNLK